MKFLGNRNLLLWWIVLWLQMGAAALAAKLGILSYIWKEDVTHISIAILVVHFLVTLRIGIDTARRNETYIEPLLYFATAPFYLGIAGTVAGFLILTRGMKAIADPTVEVLKAMLSNMTTGMSTAFWPTECAVLSSLILLGLVMNLKMAVRERAYERG